MIDWLTPYWLTVIAGTLGMGKWFRSGGLDRLVTTIIGFWLSPLQLRVILQQLGIDRKKEGAFKEAIKEIVRLQSLARSEESSPPGDSGD